MSTSPPSASPASVMRQLIAQDRITLLPGVYDGLSARLVERLGFQAGNITGAGLSESLIGRPDVGLLHPDAILRSCRSFAGVVSIPLLADGDTGFGNAVNTYYATREFEDAGVAAVFFEDQAWPKRCGHLAGKQLIPLREMQRKVAAAVRARRDDDFVIMARTDAASVTDLDDAVRRARAYVAAGADIVFPDAIATRDDIGRFVEAVGAPVFINMGFGLRRRDTTELLSPRALEDLGVTLVGYPRLITASAVAGMRLALQALAAQADAPEVDERPDLLISFAELTALTGLDEIEHLDAALARAVPDDGAWPGEGGEPGGGPDANGARA